MISLKGAKAWTLAVFVFMGAPHLLAADSSQPLNLQGASIPETRKTNFLCLGYRFGTENLRAPDGHLVTEEEYAKDTKEAFDYKRWISLFIKKQKPPIPFEQEESKIRQRLIAANYRLDPETSQVLSLSNQTLSHVAGECLFRYLTSDSSDHVSPYSIESAAAGIADVQKICGQNPKACPQQKELLKKKLDFFAAKDPGFKKLLHSGPHSQADILHLFQESRSQFDGEQTISSLINRAFGKYSTTLKPLPAYDNGEGALNRALQGQVIMKLSRNPEGRKVLERLKVNGKIILPPIFVLEAQKNMGAFYQWTPQGDRVVLNAKYVFQGAPDKKKLISDFRAGNRYLLEHPEVLKGYLKKYDDILAHELTHTWQERRDHVSTLSHAHLLVHRDYIEEEQEAFLTQARYLSYAALKDPTKAMDSELTSFIRNPRQFSDSIKDRYLSGFGSSAATFKTAAEIAREHGKIDRNMAAPPQATISQKIVQWLKIKLNLAGDFKESNNVGALRREYASRIGNLIANSGDLIKRTRRKIGEWDMDQAHRERNPYIRIADLVDATQFGSRAAQREIEFLIQTKRLDPAQTPKRMLFLAKNIALKKPGHLTTSQLFNLRKLLVGSMYLNSLSTRGKPLPPNASSQINRIWFCGTQGINCQRLKK